MTPADYLEMLNERRQTLTDMPRVWADYNMELEILQASPSRDIADMAIADCKRIIADLKSRPQMQDIADALEIKRNQLEELLLLQ